MTTVLEDPRATLQSALTVLSGDLSRAARVDALHAVAQARIELGDSSAAGAALRTALRLATGDQLAELRLTMAWVHFDTGDLDGCFALLDQLAESPRVRCLRGLACCAAGDHASAEPLLSTAVGQLTDPRWLANALCARGICRSYDACRLAEADADFVAAQALYASIGATERAASCVHNRGFVAFRAGDLPLALRLYDEAERAGMRSDQRGETLVDRAGALLAGGLVNEAAAVLERAARLLGDAGRGTTFAEATLSLARCALVAGSPDTAISAASGAAEMFSRQGRHAWTAAARALELRARFLSEPVGDLVPVARRVAAQCKRAGWRVEAAELLLAAADHAPELLPLVAAERFGPTAALRAVGWLAKARLATDRRGVHAACRAGLRVVEEQLSLMGSLELRAGAAALGSALAETGLRAALSSGHARQVLAWTDRYRSLTWRVAPVRPPADPEVAADLARLRTAQDVELTARIEQDIRRRALAAPAALALPVDATLTGLRDRLGPRALVSFGEQDGRLWATVMVDGAVRLRHLGPVAAIQDEAERLRFATAVAVQAGRGASAARHSAELLDQALLGPIHRLIKERSLVIVPCGQLRKVPWPALPSCAGRPVSIAPSAAAWLGASMAPAADGAPVWIAGPGLQHAEREVESLGGRFGGQVLTGKSATVDRVLAAVSGVSVAHVAAHGTFRSDAPMFSNLRLADGPVYGYDLDRLDRSPRVLILSACEVGRSAGAGTPIGLASVVFRRGTAVLIASTMPVPDDQAAELMATLHHGLHTGQSPAEALAAAQLRHGHLGFLCVGAG